MSELYLIKALIYVIERFRTSLKVNNRLEMTETWFYRKILIITSTEYVSNDEV